jgi:hypothetical protein
METSRFFNALCNVDIGTTTSNVGSYNNFPLIYGCFMKTCLSSVFKNVVARISDFDEVLDAIYMGYDEEASVIYLFQKIFSFIVAQSSS